MKKSFQLSAIAIAIAASSSAIAGVSVNGSPSFGTINTTTVSINNLDPGNQVQTTMDDTGLTVDNKISTINPGSAGTPTSTAPIELPLTGTPNAPVSVTGTVTQSLENQQRTESTQVYDPNKVQFTSSDVIGTEITSITDIEITGQYDANGVLDAGSVSATSTPQALPANPFTPTSTNNQQELTLGRENTSEDYRLSISKNDNGILNESEVTALGISTTGTLDVDGVATFNGAFSANNGASVTGGLTADVATVAGALSAGASTLDSLSVTNAAALNGGASVINGLTADTATVTGALSAGASTLDSLSVTNAAALNGGASVVNGLTADTATVTGALSAGASTLDSLTVTNATMLNGTLSANAGADVTGGLTADTATVNGMFTVNGGSMLNGGTSINDGLTVDHVLADTLASNRLQAPQIVLAGRDVNADADGVVQVIDSFTPNGTTVNRLTGRYDVNGTDVYALTVFEDGVETQQYYTFENGSFVAYAGDVSGIVNGTIAPDAGGTTTSTNGTLTTGSVKNVITDRNVTYSEQVTTQDATNINGSLNDGELITDVPVGTGTTTTVEQSVVNGIIGTDSEGGNIYGLEVSKTDANGTATTTVTANSVSTGSVIADQMIVGGTDVKATLDQHSADIATNTANIATNTANIATNTANIATNTSNIAANADKINTVDQRLTTEVGRLDGRIDDAAADTLANANAYTDATATTLRGEAAAETTRVNKAIADGDAATLASANTYTNATATTLRGEAAAETTRVNKAIADGNTATLASANTYTDSKAVETLATANSYTNARVNQLNSRVDDVEKTAYRGIAIALAAQQAIPSIQPGQIAVFGGVGHYEGETAGAVGLVGALNDRTSLSAALGFAGGNEVGGRVGVAYVFGGK